MIKLLLGYQECKGIQKPGRYVTESHIFPEELANARPEYEALTRALEAFARKAERFTGRPANAKLEFNI